MRITLRHVGQIKEAEVEVSGLTVIAGENGTGKSTVGKTLFAVVRAISDYDQEFTRACRKRIQSCFDGFFNDVRNNILVNRLNKKNSFLDLIGGPLFSFWGKEHLEGMFTKLIEDKDFRATYSFVDHLGELLTGLNLKSPADKERGVASLKQIRDLLSEMEISEPSDKLRSVLQATCDNLTHGQINNIWSANKKGEVSLAFDDRENSVILSYILKRPGSVVTIEQFSKEYAAYVVPDVAFIETPLILQLEGRDVEGIPVYWQDLRKKIRIGDKEQKLLKDGNAAISERIKNIIGGELIFDSDLQQFLFLKDDKKERLHVNNLASGVKVFSIFQRLARNGYLHPGHLLIIDEPENHLHPQWQVRLAEMLVDLVADCGMQIVLTSHSPYFVQAIKTFSRRKEIWDTKTKVYFAEEQEGGAVIKNLSEYPGEDNPVFRSFYQAYQDMDKGV